MAVPDMQLRGACIALLLGCLLSAFSLPALAERGIPWNQLTDGEQEVLQKHRRSWSSYDRGEQSRLQRGARSYLELPREKREAVRRKRDEYKRMSPEERERLRKQYSRERR